MRPFLDKFCEIQRIRDESILRKKNYVPLWYESTLESIRSDIGGNCAWISMDETTDLCGRYIANFVFGKLHSDERHLLACKVLEETNHSTMAGPLNYSRPSEIENCCKVLVLQMQLPIC